MTANPSQRNYISKLRAVYHNSSSKVYFFGGQIGTRSTDPSQTQQTSISLSSILSYNTITGAWLTENVVGDIVPTPRFGHTATLRMYKIAFFVNIVDGF